jgi:excisionase family DNA binding protein
MPKWLTTEQVAASLNVSEHSLRQWLREGRVPGAAKLPSGRYRLPANAIKYLLTTREAETSEQGGATVR